MEGMLSTTLPSVNGFVIHGFLLNPMKHSALMNVSVFSALLSHSLHCFLSRLGHCLLAMLLMCSYASGISQNTDYTFTFDHLTLDQGLSHTTVHAIIEDSKGMIWIGTQYGLNRYDGYDCKIFLPDSDQPGHIGRHAIYSLMEDKSGDIWVGHQDGGLSIYSAHTETFSRFPSASFPSIDWETVSVRSIFQDRRKNIWIGTYGAGTVVLDSNRQPIMQLCSFCDPANRKLTNDFVFDFEEDARGNIWIGTAGEGVEVYDPIRDEVRHITGRNEDRITGFGRELSLDKEGDLWVGTSGNGICIVDLPEERVRERIVASGGDGLSHNMITDLLTGPDGQMWVATDGGGLAAYHVDSGEWQQFHYSVNHPGVLNTESLYDLMFDRKGNLWVGTFNGGLNVHRAALAPIAANREYARERFQGLRSVLALAQDPREEVWMGTDGSGLFKLNLDGPTIQIQPFDPLDSLFSARVITSLAVVSDEMFWIGTYGEGLFMVDKRNQRQQQFIHDSEQAGSISHNNVWDLVVDHQGGLWVGTLGGGLNYLAPGAAHFVQMKDLIPEGGIPLSGVQIVDMLLDKQGRFLWVATENEGLNRIDLQTFAVTWYQHEAGQPETMSSNRLRCLYEDREGNIWIGTEYAGMNKIPALSEQVERYDTQDGLPSDMINSIVQDHDGYLWISTQAGITRWDQQSHSFINIGSDPYLDNNQFNPNASLTLKDGRLIFGSTNGYTIVLPDNISDDDTSPPEVVFADLYISNQLISIGADKENHILNGPLNDSETVVNLSYKDRGIQIFLSADHVADASHWGYEYRLREYESQWHTLEAGQRTVNYSGLPGGSYFLEVRTMGPEGTRGPVKMLELTVAPPFWQTTWFFLLCVLVAVLVLLGGLAYLLQQQRISFHEKAMQAEQEILRLNNENLEKDVANQQARLTASLLQVAHKNNLLNDLKTQIKEVQNEKARTGDLKKLIREIDRELKQEDYWQQFQFVFDSTYTEFIQTLQERYPNLTEHEKRLCCFIRMGLANREISSILNITINGVEQAKYRIKKKLQLEKELSLNDLIRSI